MKNTFNLADILLFLSIFFIVVQIFNKSALALADNGVLGDPYVSCGTNNIEVRFDTRNTFKGLVFVQGHLDEPECRSAPTDNTGLGSRNAQIRLNFKNCGLQNRDL
uniref:ZP domain-containing protein n=1 Tax=Ditylenchus dipsaci TaxID=166011 RepID=A0A915E4D9_9BILA